MVWGGSSAPHFPKGRVQVRSPAFLSPLSALRGPGPGQIPCSDRGRAESGTGRFGPAGACGASSGLAAWGAARPPWSLSQAPSAGKASVDEAARERERERAPASGLVQSAAPCDFPRRFPRPCGASLSLDRAVRAAVVSRALGPWVGLTARIARDGCGWGPGAIFAAF